jgi:hypothetical protein
VTNSGFFFFSFLTCSLDPVVCLASSFATILYLSTPVTPVTSLVVQPSSRGLVVRGFAEPDHRLTISGRQSLTHLESVGQRAGIPISYDLSALPPLWFGCSYGHGCLLQPPYSLESYHDCFGLWVTLFVVITIRLEHIKILQLVGELRLYCVTGSHEKHCNIPSIRRVLISRTTLFGSLAVLFDPCQLPFRLSRSEHRYMCSQSLPISVDKSRLTLQNRAEVL